MRPGYRVMSPRDVARKLTADRAAERAAKMARIMACADNADSIDSQWAMIDALEFLTPRPDYREENEE